MCGRSIRRHGRRAGRAGRAMALGAAFVLGAAAAPAQQPREPAAGQPPPGAGEPSAHATFVDTAGRQVGSASLIETPHGVLILTDLAAVAPGTHGFHIHQTGRCDPPDFASAGGHFNPTGRRHGFLVEEGMHAGDLPNITVDDRGTLRVEMLARDVTLGDGANSLLAGDGSALVIHQDPDDYRTDPSGNSGARIACAVILR